MKRKTAFHWTLSVSILSIIFVGMLSSDVFADGTETLGDPIGITVSPGSGAVAAGVGLAMGQPGDINFTIDAGLTINQVLLYWEGQMSTDVLGDDTITVNGISVTGNDIGGQTQFFSGAYSSAFRADITGLGLVSTGANTLTISDMDFTKINNGAGVVVIVDDGTNVADLQIKDGLDLAYYAFSPPLDSTVMQTYNIAPSTDPRKAEITLFASSVLPDRPNSIEVTVDGVLHVFSDLLNDGDGHEWDTEILEVDIPAGASVVTVQLFSRDDNMTGKQPASLGWIVGMLSVLEEENGDYQGLTPGFWKVPKHWSYWTGYNLTDDYETVFGVTASFHLTLLETLWQGGGQEYALGRHAVAAILNASHPDVNYFYSIPEIIALVQDAYATGDFNYYKDLLEEQNELGL